MLESLVIVGAGQAAAQLIASLAQDGFAGSVTLVGDEPYLPYQRPPLSKKFLAGELAFDRLYVRPAAFYEKAGTRLMLGTTVGRIDRQDKTVVLADGSRLPYSTLVLATGSRARTIPLPGADREGVYFLRTIADVEALRAQFQPGKSLVVVGGGYIGLELAAVAAKQGLKVTVLEQAPRVMGRGVGPVVSRFYERLHREEGVDVRTGVAVRGLCARPCRVHRRQPSGRPDPDRRRRGAQCRAGARGGARGRGRHHGRCPVPHLRSGDLRDRRLHGAASRFVRPAPAARVGAQRAGAGTHRRGRDHRQASARPAGAVVLVGSVRREAADGRTVSRPRRRQSCAAIPTKAGRSPSSTCARARCLQSTP